MAKHDGVLPCCNCGRGTYTDDDEPGMVFCAESGVCVLVCEEIPIWKEAALAEAEAAQPAAPAEAKDQEKVKANA